MNTDNALGVGTHGTYANRNIMADTYARIVSKGEEMKKRKRKFNFWDMLPKITQTFMACMSVYVMHREYDKTGTISGLSFVLPLMMLVYFLLLQVFEINEEENNE